MTDDHQTGGRHEENIREHVREDIEMYAQNITHKRAVPEGVEDVEAWVAHIICSEANKHLRDGLD